MRRVFTALSVFATIAVALNAQSFEVASIHPHAPEDTRFLVRPPTAGHFTAVGAVGRLLVTIAYDVQESQIVGGPAWFETDKWDIEAKSDNDRHSAEETRRMLQSLLEQRFSLKIHRETEQRSVYALTVAKGGPRLKPSEGNKMTLQAGANSLSIQAGDIAAMAGVLAKAVGRPVVNRTGLTGRYDILLQWDDAPTADSDHGSIFTALREQLGLRLEPRKEPAEVIVVDAMERPSAN
jgi:uncharacterized protein (TIGR03435 family)